jgi:hypothetical protein
MTVPRRQCADPANKPFSAECSSNRFPTIPSASSIAASHHASAKMSVTERSIDRSLHRNEIAESIGNLRIPARAKFRCRLLAELLGKNVLDFEATSRVPAQPLVLRAPPWRA